MDFNAPQMIGTLHDLATAVDGYNAAIEAGDLAGAQAWADSISYIGGVLGSDLGYNGGIVRSYSGLPAQGKSIGSQFGAGLAAGLNAKLPGIVAKARAAANQIAAAFRSAWQIHSPSRVAQNLTEMFGAGLEKGMDKWPTVSQRMLENDMALAYGYSLRAADVIGSTTNNNNNSVNLNVEQMNVSDRQDAEALAYEIADLSRRRNMGRGLR